jgi:hypothetical protein
MASVRKRSWKSGGEMKTAWVADYLDQAGKRRLKTFERKKEADLWLVNAAARSSGASIRRRAAASRSPRPGIRGNERAA